MLTVEFLLGMAVSLIGLPSETTGSAKTETIIFLGLHVFLAAGLIVGAILAIRTANKLEFKAPPFDLYCRCGHLYYLYCRVLTMITESNWWSFMMAVGFIVSLLIYEEIILQAKRS